MLFQKNDRKTEKWYRKESAFHADWIGNCMKSIFFFFSTEEKCGKLWSEKNRTERMLHMKQKGIRRDEMCQVCRLPLFQTTRECWRNPILAWKQMAGTWSIYTRRKKWNEGRMLLTTHKCFPVDTFDERTTQHTNLNMSSCSLDRGV